MSITILQNVEKIYRHEEPDFLPLITDLQVINSPEPGIVSKLYGTKPEKHEQDWFGQYWTYEPTLNAFNPDANRYAIQDITHWRDYVHIPDVDAFDWEAKFKKDNVVVNPEKFFIVNDGYGLWERMFSTIPIADLLCDLIEEPEACQDYLEAITEYKIKLHNKYLDYYHPRVLRMHDDYGNGGGLFMSPSTFRSIIKPYLQRIIDNVRAHGAEYEHHCCGFMRTLAPEIAEMGAVSWQNIHSCNDIQKTVEECSGKITMVQGFLNHQFCDSPNTTEEELRTHVREVMSIAYPGRGIIISNGECRVHKDRNAIINDEILKNQHLFKERRPE